MQENEDLNIFFTWLLDPVTKENEECNKLKKNQSFISNLDKFRNKISEPEYLDKLFLLVFLERAIHKKERIVIFKNRRKILKKCGLSDGSLNYSRLWKSCKLWTCFSVSLKISNKYNNVFNILNWVEYDELKKELSMEFNRKFFFLFEKSNFKFLLGEFQKPLFRRSLSKKLNLLLEKKSSQDISLKIDIKKISQKLTLDCDFPSQVYQKITPALNELNRQSNRHLEVETLKMVNNQNIIVFGDTGKHNRGKLMKIKNKGKDTITVLENYEPREENLMSLLQDIQKMYGYISEENMGIICDYINVPLSRGYSVATFYQSFSLIPKGEHDIHVCLGTACHLKGSNRIIEELKRKLNIAPGETTQDMKITYNSVNCVGACAIAPVVVIDGDYFPNMNTKKIIDKIKKFD